MARRDPVRGRRRRSAPEIEFLCGLHPVREALRARRRVLSHLWIQEDLPRDRPPIHEILELGLAAGVPVEAVTPARLEARAGAGVRTQGLGLLVGPLPEVSLGRLAGGASPQRLVVLDGIEDPQNLGAIIRVGEASGAAGLILTRRRAPPLSPSVARASAGALEHLPITLVTNLPRALESLKRKGFWIFGADAEEGADLFSLPDRLLEGPQAFVFGSEGRGLRPGVVACLDHRIRVPLRGNVASLNVASAAAVVLFEALRRAPNAAPR